MHWIVHIERLSRERLVNFVLHRRPIRKKKKGWKKEKIDEWGRDRPEKSQG